MPHKHTRKGEVDKSTLDLPPTQIAQPLPVSKSAAANGIFTTDLNNTKRSNKKRKRKDTDDDTPKAFMRLMAFSQGKKLPKGLDDGVRISKSERKKMKLAAEKKDAQGGTAAVKQEKIEVVGVAKEVPTIRPGERMSDFAARVDAALPVSGLINKTAKGGKDPLGLKIGRTKTEKKMHKLYDTWREEERKIQDRKMDALEDAEELAEDSDGQVNWKAELETAPDGKAGKKNKKKRKKVLGEVDDGDEDPWARIKKDRGEGDVKFGEVVLAPPVFSKMPTEKFKTRVKVAEVGDVPKASGSLRRREELGEVRRSVVEGYRQMMKENREKAKEKA